MGGGGSFGFPTGSFTAPFTSAVAQFRKPKRPKGIPDTPDRSDAAVQEARRKALEEEASARGRRATLLTGGAGVTSQPLVRRAALLSGA